MLLKFYRRLDLLNRIYVLNYFETTLLDQSSVLEIPALSDKSSLVTQIAPYNNLQDLRLILYCQSKQWVYHLFKQVLMSLIVEDRNLLLNGKLLLKIQQQLSKEDLQLILDNSYAHDTGFAIAHLIEEYDLKMLIEYLEHVYFSPLIPHIAKKSAKRFLPKKLNLELVEKLQAIDNLDERVLRVFEHAMPQTYQIFSELGL